MSIELGIALAADGDSAAALTAVARQADEGGLDLLVVTPPEGGTGLDLSTTATWLVGRTERIQVGVATARAPAGDHADPDAAYPTVVAKAAESGEWLAPSRLLPPDARWLTAPAHASWEQLVELATAGLPVVVPVRTTDDVAAVVTLADKARSADTTPNRRPLAVRARRRPGIDYDGLPGSLAERAVEPGDAAYRSVTSTYLRGGAPGLVLRPRTVDEVVAAVAFARRHRHLPLGLRSGGHGISGRSTNDGGLVIDVGAMNSIEVLDEDRRLVRVGPGATWKQVAAALDGRGWAIGSGDYGGVGVGGLATAGGIGFLSREHGLTIDRLRAVELVLADGRPVRASEDENPDLFWAVRGAGANFGVATAFELEASEVGEVGWAQLVLVVPDIAETLRRYAELTAAAPRDTTVYLVTGRPRQGHWVVQLYAMVDSGDADVVVERLTPFTELGVLVQQQAAVVRYTDVMAQAADVGAGGHHGTGDPVSRSAFLPALTPGFAEAAADLLRSGLVHFFQLRAMGGAIADVSPAATAFAHRDPAFQLTAMGVDPAGVDAAWDGLAGHFDGLYLSFDTDLRPDRVRDAFPLPTLARLRALKREYDPHNLFRDNFNIDPEVRDATADPTGASA